MNIEKFYNIGLAVLTPWDLRWPRGRISNLKIISSKPISPKDPPCLRASCILNLTLVKHPIANVARKLGEKVSFPQAVKKHLEPNHLQSFIETDTAHFQLPLNIRTTGIEARVIQTNFCTLVSKRSVTKERSQPVIVVCLLIVATGKMLLL
ncbi:hypothetical protein AVEN_131960-1 [Araneus ventricosus]|uniref:Uncharacterized protein n=1 Tax=Araneus ventricosus TaxID=182803 RepID=A0A4Y2B323_ARAVE|nr:hypothetical protein AVEN_131960-1 [Araneus ventricosus]